MDKADGLSSTQMGWQKTTVDSCGRWRICCRTASLGLYSTWGNPCIKVKNECPSLRFSSGTHTGQKGAHCIKGSEACDFQAYAGDGKLALEGGRDYRIQRC